MSKIKNVWKKNKILIVLLSILLICFIAIVVVCLTFFLGGNKSVYGERLKDIDKYPITENFKKDYSTTVKEEKGVNEVKIDVKGKIIYVTINFAEDTTLDEAESIAGKSVDEFDEKTLGYYDIQFTLLCEESDNSEGFTMMGAHNATGSGIVWNNNTKVESETK